MDIKISDQAKDVLGKRGIKDADVMDVVKTAESTGRKLTDKGGAKSLAKKRIGEITVYADYTVNGGAANINSAYSHRMQLGEVVPGEQKESGWVCKHCGNEGAKYGTVNMTYMGITRSGPAVVCPKCGDSWIEEYLAIKTIAAAEGLFEKKKA